MTIRCIAPPRGVLRNRGLVPLIVAGCLFAEEAALSANGEGYLGLVYTEQAVNLSTRTAGTVRELRVALGDFVQRDQVLMVVESPGLEQQLTQARADVLAARADSIRAAVELAQTNTALQRRRDAANLFTKEELEHLAAQSAMAQAAFESSVAVVSKRVAALRSLESDYASLSIRAPFDGQIAQCGARVAQYVLAEEPILRIADTRSPWVRFAVPASEHSLVFIGQFVSISAGTGRAANSARVGHISPEVDAVSGMLMVEAKISNQSSGSSPPLGSLVRVMLASVESHSSDP